MYHNFSTTAEKALTFDCFYGGSMPVCPRRRKVHTWTTIFFTLILVPLINRFTTTLSLSVWKMREFTLIFPRTIFITGGMAALAVKQICGHEVFVDNRRIHEMGQVTDLTTLIRFLDAKIHKDWRHDWVNQQFITTETAMPQCKNLYKRTWFLLNEIIMMTYGSYR